MSSRPHGWRAVPRDDQAAAWGRRLAGGGGAGRRPAV